MTGTPQNRFLALYGRWEALDGCKILPQGVGTICPYFWEIWLSTKNVHFDARFVCYYCVFKPLLSSMFETQCYRQNDQTDHRIIAWFSWKSHFDMVFANQIRVFHVKPTFSIVCIIDLFLCMQHIYIYIYHHTFLSKNLISEAINPVRVHVKSLHSSWEGGQFQKKTLVKTSTSHDHVS